MEKIKDKVLDKKARSVPARAEKYKHQHPFLFARAMSFS